VRRRKRITTRLIALNLRGKLTLSSTNTPGDNKMMQSTKKVITTISGAPARNSIVTKIPVNTIYFDFLFSRYFKKYIITNGNHGTAKRWGRRLWTDNRYPESMNITPPAKEAKGDALRYLKNAYTEIPENTKWRMMSQFQTRLNGKNK